MSVYGDDTRKLIARDVAAFGAKQTAIRERINGTLAELIDEGHSPLMLRQALIGTVHYGFKLSNGEHRDWTDEERRA